jgi:hypothetical protein
MRIINPEWINLSQGYKAACDLEQQALKNWNAKWAQSVDFAREQGVKRAGEFLQAQVANEKRTLRIILIILVIPVVLMAIVNMLIVKYPDLKLFLLPIGVMNFLQAAVLLIPIAEKLLAIAALGSIKPPPEENQTSLEVTDRWWQQVSRQNPSEPASEAELGEFNLLQYFSENLPDDYFAVRNLLIQKSLHVDVLLIGPTGIWVFEIKDWQGRVTCRNGVWKSEAAIADRNLPLDQQWLEERATVEKTLGLRLARNANFGALIRGGLVFTHPNVQIDIDSSSQAQYGMPPQWLERIAATGKIAQFSTEVQLLVLDALLDYALSLYITRPLVKSAVELAKLLYGNVLEDLRQYVLRQIHAHMA